MNDKLITAASILLVDDDEQLRVALRKLLQAEGYAVVAMPDALNAIHYIEANPMCFDLVVTDVSMPGINGMTLLTVVKTAFPDVPVIIITAFGTWGEYSTAIRNGVFEYLYKPLEPDEFLDSVRRAVSRTPQPARASPPSEASRS